MKKRETVGLTQSQVNIKASLAKVGHRKQLKELASLEKKWNEYSPDEILRDKDPEAIINQIDRKKAELAGVPFYG